MPDYKITNAEFAILSLIVEHSRHGYEIEQVIEERGMRNWTEVGFSSIYYLLKKLEKSGFVQSQTQVVAGRGPARKIYEATEAGKQACQAATIKALSTPHRAYPPVQLGLANLPSLSTDDAVDALKQHQAGLIERLADLKAAQSSAPLPTHVTMMYQYSLTIVTAQLNWLADTIQQLEETTA